MTSSLPYNTHMLITEEDKAIRESWISHLAHAGVGDVYHVGCWVCIPRGTSADLIHASYERAAHAAGR